MNFPKELMYTKSHEWVRIEGDKALVGLTDYAQSELGDLVFVNLPEEGDKVNVGEVFLDVESVKAASDVYAPLSGVIEEINEELLDNPGLINKSPYEAWLVKIGEISDRENLLTAEEYEAVVNSEKE
ncbi:glycine cleavage system protein GcvH [Clostridium sp.]|uniref:glycine cleavage system protein GcvH n=1 Tax=Clostridium sp. TaxID=1506 RepID=UPI002FDD0128